MTDPGAAHLVAIDLQHVFADPDSAWCVPRFADVIDPIRRLADAYEPQVTFTRFLADPQPRGAWREYYERWTFAQVPADDRLYALVEPFAGRYTLDVTTFGKWGDALAARAQGRALVLAGVSTDCCVLSTALAAADAGAKVFIAADACAGPTDAAHERALEVMAQYEPLIEVTSTTALLGS